MESIEGAVHNQTLRDALGGNATAPSLPRICTECGFDLRPTPHAMRCPECGAENHPDSIVLPFQSSDLKAAGLGTTVVCYLVLIIVCSMLAFSGVPIRTVGIIAVGGAVLPLVIWLAVARRHRRAPQHRVIVFGPMGIAERNLGTWTSVMPYEELTGFDLWPKRRRDTRKLRVRVHVGPLPLSFARGTVSIAESDVLPVLDEVRRRIDRSAAARS